MKRISLTSACLAVIFGLALGFATAVPAAPKAAPAQPAAASPADHPQIHDALVALRTAKSHLESAKHDFGGHRADALRSVDSAIQQLEICQKYDK